MWRLSLRRFESCPRHFKPPGDARGRQGNKRRAPQDFRPFSSSVCGSAQRAALHGLGSGGSISGARQAPNREHLAAGRVGMVPRMGQAATYATDQPANADRRRRPPLRAERRREPAWSARRPLTSRSTNRPLTSGGAVVEWERPSRPRRPFRVDVRLGHSGPSWCRRSHQIRSDRRSECFHPQRGSSSD